MAPIPCPVCGKGALVRHCPDEPGYRLCEWSYCLGCRATVHRYRVYANTDIRLHLHRSVDAKGCQLCQ